MERLYTLTSIAALLSTIACTGPATEPPSGEVGKDNITVELVTDIALPDAVVFIDQKTTDTSKDTGFDGVADLGVDTPMLACEPGEGCFLDQCDENGDCQSSWCVEHLGEQVCTQTCQEECPAGWSCQQVSGAVPDLVFVCVSDYPNLCRPCSQASDCIGVGDTEDACVVYGDQGSFCGGKCGAGCPWGFKCDSVTTVDGVELEQCIAETGECHCTDTAVQLGLFTTCQVMNEFGTCLGKRICTEDGLSDCDADAPIAEICNGVDDDCDGEIDEPALQDGDYINLCEDGSDCTEDKCTGEEGCANEILESGPCEDGDPCTVADHCVEGTCIGDPVECDDDDPCTDDVCTETGGCEYPPNMAACDDGNACTLADECKEGECVGTEVPCDCQTSEDCEELEDGDLCNGTLVCDTSALPYKCVVDTETLVTCPEPEGDGAFCLQAHCDPLTGECSALPNHEDFLCDNADACTFNTKCTEGVCAGGDQVNCIDGNPCTDDACDSDAGCLHAPNQEPCDDGDTCTTNDVCSEGECAGGALLDCDDLNVCTDDSCNPTVGCQHEVNAAMCDDGNLCTDGDHCAGGICHSTGAVTCDDGNSCTLDGCDPSQGCVQSFHAGPCDDNNACTTGDQCEAGTCTPTGALDCNDGNTCTNEVCDDKKGCVTSKVADQTPCPSIPGGVCVDGICACIPDCLNMQCGNDGCGGSCGGCDDSLYCTFDTCHEGACLSKLDDFHCIIEGKCVPGGAAKPDNACLQCMPAVAQDGWSPGYLGATCLPGEVCYAGECCNPAAGCEGKECGDFGCGSSCGKCPGPQDECVDGLCTCKPDCMDKNCGADGCVGSCGECEAPELCGLKQCIPPQLDGAVGVGFYHACAIAEDLTVRCWGDNGDGQLGDGTNESHNSPAPVTDLTLAVALTAGKEHSCALRTDGTVWCWGSNDEGQLGIGSEVATHMPSPVAGISSAIRVSAGDSHSCALLGDGTARCWGYNNVGQLGNGTNLDSDESEAVDGLVDCSEIGASAYYSCAVCSGTVWCWGSNSYGNFGDGSKDSSVVPVQAAEGLVDVTGVAVGFTHSCAVKDDGSVSCWGDNSFGQLGDGSKVDSPFPKVVPGISDAISVVAGAYHTCTLHVGGAVSCWGRNSVGNLGDGTLENKTVPTAVKDVDGAVSLDAYFQNTCTMHSDGKLQCWGSNYFGQLGNGTGGLYSTLPVQSAGLSKAAKVVLGYYHSHAIDSDGTFWSWGKANSKQLGNGSYSARQKPTMIESLTGLYQASAGQEHTCGLDDAGDLICWGFNSFGNLGHGHRKGPGAVPAGLARLSNVALTVSGGNHSCALVDSGQAWCWGNNSYGQLGDNSNTSIQAPVEVLGLDSVVSLSAGDQHTCALDSEGISWCWGYNGNGQLGIATTAHQKMPVKVLGLAPASEIGTGKNHACAVVETNVWCWGDNSYGQLGDGTTGDKLFPVQVDGLSGAVGLALGDDFSCARLASEAVRCWGRNDVGQLGNSSTDDSHVVALPVELSQITHFAAGAKHVCARTVEGEVWCWGQNSEDQLGSDSVEQASSPVKVMDLAQAASVGVGDAFSCAVLGSGSVYCWGSNGNGCLGDGTADDSGEPVQALGLSSAKQISGGKDHACSTSEDGIVWCWGKADNGQLGDGTWASRSLAAPISGPPKILSFSAGGHQTCAVVAGGWLWCWGLNFQGQIGDGTFDSKVSPVLIEKLAGVVDVSVGESYTCAVTEQGMVWCWGFNSDGQLGDGTKIKKNEPMFPVSGLVGVTAISAGFKHACALHGNQTLSCWGRGFHGQLGDGAGISSWTPVEVQGINDAVAVTAGEWHTCALREDDGSVWCWGRNDDGQIGDGTTSYRKTPTPVVGLTDVVSLATNYRQNCTARTDGSVWCWGYNASGQLGDGSEWSDTPVEILLQ